MSATVQYFRTSSGNVGVALRGSCFFAAGRDGNSSESANRQFSSSDFRSRP